MPCLLVKSFEFLTDERTSEASSDSSSKTGCLPGDSMCTMEKDGTVVKCSSSKDLQPHPKDERRFLDCTGSKIQIYTCPPNLTFHPDNKKCKWQFIL
ncbi:hypothetical protein AVEN_224715-1 [Araneus ventricosus]|uniref:Chitin-binding type-2 domain-containing protein n=1 Tax=Araneus ventricosus TaxID=182803 RepID=A0A4Y2QM87_ARAVE|nr:hypothetical protein AVEN_224715-1 [Araneus ventricosus]